MKIPTTRRIATLSALALGVPFAAFGLVQWSRVEQGLASPASPAASESCVEIRVSGGGGEAIAKALAALPARGGRIFLEAGTYVVERPLVLDRDHVELSGAGEGTVLVLGDGAECPLVVIGPLETPPERKVRGIALRHLVLDGNRQQQGSECHGGPCDQGGLSFIRNNALTIRSAEDIRVEHVTTRAARSGGLVLEKHSRRIHVSDFTSYGNHFDGLAAYETEESFFTRLDLHGNDAAGISIDLRFNRNIISHARLEGNGSQGIFMRDSNFNNFNHLTVSGNGAQGIFVAQADGHGNTPCIGNIFSDLAVRGSRGVGLRINDISCIANVLANSSFSGNGEGGVSEVSEKLIAQQNVLLE